MPVRISLPPKFSRPPVAVFPFYLDLADLAAAHWAGLGLAAAALMQAVSLLFRAG